MMNAVVNSAQDSAVGALVLGQTCAPDWHDWVPQRARAASSRFVAGFSLKGALAAEYGHDSWSNWELANNFTDESSLEAVLQASCFLERLIEFGDTAVVNEASFAVRFARELFQGLLAHPSNTAAAVEDWCTTTALATPVLATLGALGVGLHEEVVTEEEFLACVDQRRSRQQEAEDLIHKVEAGNFV